MPARLYPFSHSFLSPHRLQHSFSPLPLRTCACFSPLVATFDRGGRAQSPESLPPTVEEDCRSLGTPAIESRSKVLLALQEEILREQREEHVRIHPSPLRLAWTRRVEIFLRASFPSTRFREKSTSYRSSLGSTKQPRGWPESARLHRRLDMGFDYNCPSPLERPTPAPLIVGTGACASISAHQSSSSLSSPSTTYPLATTRSSAHTSQSPDACFFAEAAMTSAPLPSPSNRDTQPQFYFQSLAQQQQTTSTHREGLQGCRGRQTSVSYEHHPRASHTGGGGGSSDGPSYMSQGLPIPPRQASNAPETSKLLGDFTLVAEAAKRAQMACLMRDMGEMEMS